MVGLETAFAIVHSTMIATGLMGWNRLSQVMSSAPAEIGRYSDQGEPLHVGATANITLVDPSKSWTVSRDDLFSKSNNTPFHGFTFTGAVLHTIYRGTAVLLNHNLTGARHE